ncbi:MAG: sigma-70 family RNA polymerase sigma factor [Planctomycetota bacterium]|nr:MAG: sigma-70 family RNA polymerase sigma factor [Planctomycetota bacterium]
MIPETQVTLLARLRDPADEAAWLRFESRYRELVVRFCMREGLQAADAEDVAQAVFASLLSAMQRFNFDATRGRFRDYLFRAVRNEIPRQLARSRRPNGGPSRLVSGDEGTFSDLRSTAITASAQAFEDEWINHHFRLAFAIVRQTHSTESVAIFERLMRGDSVEAVATQFSTTQQAVHKTKQRIRDRMKVLVESQIAQENM